MPIVKPKLIRVPGEANNFELSVNVLAQYGLAMRDELVIAELARFRPRTLIREGDLVLLPEPPGHLRRKLEIIPRIWKVRFVVSEWAIKLMQYLSTTGNAVSLEELQKLLEREYQRVGPSDRHTPYLYVHGYPHGQYPNSAAWLYQHMVRPLMFNETPQSWEEITNEHNTEYAGFDTDAVKLPFTLDYAPSDYGNGISLKRPFISEEPLVNTLCLLGLEETLMVPHRSDKRIRALEHDAYAPPLPSSDD